MMRSSSRADRAKPRLFHRAALLTLLAGVSACRNEEIFETQILTIAETAACEEGIAAGLTVNAYRVMLFELTGDAPEGERFPCLACLETGRCELVAQRCRCGRPNPPTSNLVNRALDGVRFPDLDPEARYCVGVAGFSLPALPPPEDLPPPGEALGQTSRCGCDFEGLELANSSRFCGISALPARVDENAALILINAECRRCPPLEYMFP